MKKNSISITIDTGNAAFDEEGGNGYAFEVAAILKTASEKLQDGHREFKLYDTNGNHVGKVVAK
jgi:hypothetical protein